MTAQDKGCVAIARRLWAGTARQRQTNVGLIDERAGASRLQEPIHDVPFFQAERQPRAVQRSVFTDVMN